MKNNKTDKKLKSAISVIAEIISREAKAMKNDNNIDVKRLKELTGSAKELATVIKTLENEDVSAIEGDGTTIRIIFDGESEKWAT